MGSVDQSVSIATKFNQSIEYVAKLYIMRCLVYGQLFAKRSIGRFYLHNPEGKLESNR